MLSTVLSIIGTGISIGMLLFAGYNAITTMLGKDSKKPESALNGETLLEEGLVFTPENKKKLNRRYKLMDTIQKCIDNDQTNTEKYKRAVTEYKEILKTYRKYIPNSERNSYIRFFENFIEESKKTKKKRKYHYDSTNEKRGKQYPIQNPSNMHIDSDTEFGDYLESPMGQFLSHIKLSDGIKVEKELCVNSGYHGKYYPWVEYEPDDEDDEVA